MKLSQDFNLQQVYMLSRIFYGVVTITVYDVRRREESYNTSTWTNHATPKETNQDEILEYGRSSYENQDSSMHVSVTCVQRCQFKV